MNEQPNACHYETITLETVWHSLLRNGSGKQVWYTVHFKVFGFIVCYYHREDREDFVTKPLFIFEDSMQVT